MVKFCLCHFVLILFFIYDFIDLDKKKNFAIDDDFFIDTCGDQ